MPDALDAAPDRAPLVSDENHRMTFWLTPNQRAAFLRKQGEAGHRYISEFIVAALGLDTQPSDGTPHVVPGPNNDR